MIVENSNDSGSRTYRVYPESKENITKVNSYSTTSQPYSRTGIVEQSSR